MTSTAPRQRDQRQPAAQSAPDLVGMQLVHLRKSMESFRSRVLEASGHGLEGSGLAVLYHLSTAGPMRTSTLAELLGLDPSTTSRHVAGLERSGHVERVADPADGRAFLVGASEAGRVAFEDTRALRNALVATLLDGWTPTEVQSFVTALTRFNEAVDALGDDTITETLTKLAPARLEDHR